MILKQQALSWQYMAVHKKKDSLDTVTLLVVTRGALLTR